MQASGRKRSLIEALTEPIYDFFNECDVPGFDALVLTFTIMGCGMVCILLAYFIGAVSGVGTHHLADAHPRPINSAYKGTITRTHSLPLAAHPQAHVMPYPAAAHPQIMPFQPHYPPYQSGTAYYHEPINGLNSHSLSVHSHPHAFGKPKERSSKAHLWYPFANGHFGEAYAAPLNHTPQ